MKKFDSGHGHFCCQKINLGIVKFALYLTYLFVTLRRVYLQKAAITMVKAVAIYGWVQLVLILAPILTLDWGHAGRGQVVVAIRSLHTTQPLVPAYSAPCRQLT